MRLVVKMLVYAAEQIYGDGRGKDKLQYVKDQLIERGYDIDLDEIEAAVYDAFNKWEYLEPIEANPDEVK